MGVTFFLWQIGRPAIILLDLKKIWTVFNLNDKLMFQLQCPLETAAIITRGAHKRSAGAHLLSK